MIRNLIVLIAVFLPLAASEAYVDLPDREDVVTDSPWMLAPGRDKVPVLIFLPEVLWAPLDDPKTPKVDGHRAAGIYVREVVIAAAEGPDDWSSDPAWIPTKHVLFRDTDTAGPSAGLDLVVENENGAPPDPRVFRQTGIVDRSIPITTPGWHRIVMIPRDRLIPRVENGEAVAYICTYVETARYLRRDPRYDTWFAKLRGPKPPEDLLIPLAYPHARMLRVELPRDPLPGLGRGRPFDVHFHTQSEYTREEGITSPRKAFGGPLRMVTEAAHAIGLVGERDPLRVRNQVFSTDHNCFYSDSASPAVGPYERVKNHPEQESTVVWDYFGRATAGQEVALHKEAIGIPWLGRSVGFTLGMHCLVWGANAPYIGPWHGGISRMGPFGPQLNHLTVERVMKDLARQGGHAIAAHPWSGAFEWPDGEMRRGLALRPYNTRDAVAPDGFVLRGVQFANGVARKKLADVTAENYARLNVYRTATAPTARTSTRKSTVPPGMWEKVYGWSPRTTPLKSPDGAAVASSRALPDGSTEVTWSVDAIDREGWKEVPGWGAEYQDGLARWESLARDGLAYYFQAAPRAAVEVFPRKVFIAAGSDAHGDFGTCTDILATLVAKFISGQNAVTENAYGRIRTFAYDGAPDDVKHGRTCATTGPVVALTLDAQATFDSDARVWSEPARRLFDARFRGNKDGRIGGDGAFDGGRTLLIPSGDSPTAAISAAVSDEHGGAIRGIELRAVTGERTAITGPFGGSWTDQLVPVPWSIQVPTAIYAVATTGDPARPFDDPRSAVAITNPVWVMPVDLEIVVKRFEHRRGGSLAAEPWAAGDEFVIVPGGVTVKADFWMTMARQSILLRLRQLDSKGIATGPEIVLNPAGGGHWENLPDQGSARPATKDAIFTAENEVPIVLKTDAAWQFPQSPLLTFAVTWVAPREVHGSALNSIAATATVGLHDKPKDAASRGEERPAPKPVPAPRPAPTPLRRAPPAR